MAALTAGQLIDEVAVLMGSGGNSSDDYRVSILRALDRIGAEIWSWFSWPERQVEYLFGTVAPYEAGTVQTTVTSANIVGTGTTWTSGMVGSRFALSTTSPWYRLLTFGSTTTFALDRVYVGASASGQTYTIYCDEFGLATTVEQVTSVGIMAPGYQSPVPLTEQRTLDDGALVPVTRGKPTTWSPVAPLAATPHTRRIRLWPVPDAAYDIRIRGNSFWTHLTSESDTPSFHQDREALAIYGTCLALKHGGEDEASMKPFYDELDRMCGKTKVAKPWSGRRARMDESGPRRSPYGPVSA